MAAMEGLKLPKGYSSYNLPTMGGGQKELYDLFKGQVSGGVPDVFQKLLGMARGDQGTFSQMEAPLMRQFEQEILPGIAQRYAGHGISGSSGMQNSLSNAATNLGTNLQAQRSDLMRQSMHDVLGIGQNLLGMQTQQSGLVQNKSVINDLLKLLGGGLGSLGGTYGGIKLAGR